MNDDDDDDVACLLSSSLLSRRRCSVTCHTAAPALRLKGATPGIIGAALAPLGGAHTLILPLLLPLVDERTAHALSRIAEAQPASRSHRPWWLPLVLAAAHEEPRWYPLRCQPTRGLASFVGERFW